jgi:acetolactate synthase-1/2/3 large subunit
MQRCVRNTWLSLTGGSIGQGGPAAVGAAIACPDRQVFALLGDGGAMYTNQFLWTAARERLNLITVIYSNRSYGILDVEYRRLGINDVGAKAASLFDLSGPAIDWVALAAAQGVAGVRAETCEAFAAALQQAIAGAGPFLIEAVV